MIAENLTPDRILTAEAFHNACVTTMAVGGSTNSLIHMLAMAGRAGVDLTLDSFDSFSRSTPTLVNVRPSGEFLMEDFFEAGGLPALLEVLRPLLKTDAMTVNGRTIGENIAGKQIIRPEVIRPLDNPISPTGGICVLKGNLAPNGCVMKPTAADPRLLRHRGPAVVFENYPDLKKRLNDPDLEVTADSILILRNAGPIGGPGMPEWGMLPIPQKLLKQGVRDMVRLSDARMSGTSYGSCVLHVAPESAVGGPLALVRTGDQIELDVENRSIRLCVPDDELEKRRADWKAPEPYYGRGFGYLFSRHVTQADKGCDFDFLHAGVPTREPEIF
jgi:dihydroxy-acid dehydratase